MNHPADIVITEPGSQLQASRMLGVALTHPAAVYVASCASTESRRTIMTSLRTAARFWGGSVASLSWQTLTFAHLSSLRAHLSETRAPATANKVLSAVRGVLRMAARLGMMSRDASMAACDVMPVRGKRVSPGRSLTPEEIERLVKNCEGRGAIGARNRALLALLFGAGLRRSEVLSLNVRDYYAAATGHVTVRGKGNKDRIIYFQSAIGRAIDVWNRARWDTLREASERPDAPLFVSFARPRYLARGDEPTPLPTTERLTPNGLYRAFQAMCAQSNVPHATLHDLRRTFVGEMFDAGVDVSTIQGMVGHASPTTTASYDRRPDRVRQEAADRIRFPY